MKLFAAEFVPETEIESNYRIIRLDSIRLSRIESNVYKIVEKRAESNRIELIFFSVIRLFELIFLLYIVLWSRAVHKYKR